MYCFFPSFGGGRGLNQCEVVKTLFFGQKFVNKKRLLQYICVHGLTCGWGWEGECLAPNSPHLCKVPV